ncbi:MAG: family 10 glycosylhydrolase [Planctomycetes bacterium]|nr:family 10 glycosylhydrolase [Planctomycetota bacterium]
MTTAGRSRAPVLAIGILAALASPLSGSPSGEIRGIWVTRWDYRTAADVRAVFRNCASLGLRRVYFQVRGRADALYRSDLEPWAEELGAKDPGFDPLALAVEAAAELGMEVHAWINVLAGWKGTRPPAQKDHIFHRHPDWFLLDRYGKRQMLDSHYTIVNPCSPAVQEHVTRVITDIASRYRVDGIHLDYIRFIATGDRDRQAVPYDPPTIALFREMSGGFPAGLPREWDEFRTRAINTLVYRISRSVREVNPGASISAAVLRDFDDGRKLYFQDVPAWLRQGWIDEVVPMDYDRDNRRFEEAARKAVGGAGRERCVAGIGVYLFKTPQQLSEQIQAVRRAGGRGYVLFAYSNFFASRSHESKEGAQAEKLRARMRETLLRLNG